MENQDRSIQDPGEELLAGQQLAMVYAPMQEFARLYTPDNALMRGTLFADLDKPLVKGDR